MPFQRGNKLQPRVCSEATREKIRAGRLRFLANGGSPWNKGKKSPQTTGKKNGMWKGDFVGYHGIHTWMARTYGKADRCEMVDCPRKNNKYEWALIKNKKYERKRQNFFMLCISCHKNYDMTEIQLNFSRTRPRDKGGKFTKI